MGRGRRTDRPAEQEENLLYEKPAVAYLVKTLTVFYGIQRFITVFTRHRRWTPILSQMNPVHTHVLLI
jgi:hypothetical protein